MHTITIFITKFFLLGTATISMQVNCEYLYFSSQGTELENAICYQEYKEIEQESIEFQKTLLLNRKVGENN